MSRMRTCEAVVNCPKCGTMTAIRELGRDEKPLWPPLYCPRCGAPLPSPEPSSLRGIQNASITRLMRAVKMQRLRAKDLAAELKCSPAMVSRVLAGRCMPTDEQLLKLAELLGVDPSRIW